MVRLDSDCRDHDLRALALKCWLIICRGAMRTVIVFVHPQVAVLPMHSAMPQTQPILQGLQAELEQGILGELEVRWR